MAFRADSICHSKCSCKLLVIHQENHRLGFLRGLFFKASQFGIRRELKRFQQAWAAYINETPIKSCLDATSSQGGEVTYGGQIQLAFGRCFADRLSDRMLGVTFERGNHPPSAGLLPHSSRPPTAPPAFASSCGGALVA